VLDGELARLNPDHRLGAKIAVLYTAWMLVGFDRVHPIAGMPDKIVKAPYARTIEGLFDGRHTGDQVFNGLPNRISELITPFGTDLLRDPSGGLAAALRGTDSGAHAPAINLGTPDYQGSRHLGSNVAATARIVRWFLSPASAGAKDGAQGV
jgi:hypothetical protein